ncbi:unnamed protein product [Closterium sp. NIES-53]
MLVALSLAAHDPPAPLNTALEPPPAASAPPVSGPPAAPAARAPPTNGPPAASAAREPPASGSPAAPTALAQPTTGPPAAFAARAPLVIGPPAAPLPPARCSLSARQPPLSPTRRPLGRPIKFDMWLDDLQLYLLSVSRDSVSLFHHTSGAAPAPPATADSATCSQPSSAALPVSRAVHFATVENLVSHLRTSNTRYRAALPAEFLAKTRPPMYITLYFIVTRLLVSLRAVSDHFLALDPTTLTVGLLEQHLLAAETSVVVVGAAHGTLLTPFFEGFSPSPLSLDYACAAAADVLGAEDIGAASASAKRHSSKGKGGRGVAIIDIDYDAILAAMYALSVSAEGDCYLFVPLDPGIEAAVLGASEFVLPRTAPAEALHTFTLDSGASRCFFRDSTTLTPLSAPVPVRLADPSWGPVLARSSTVLPCPVVPSGSLSGLHLPSFSTKLVSTATLQDAMVTTTTPRGQRVLICTCTLTGPHLATFTRRPGSSLYTLTTETPQVAASAQVSASGQVAPPCSCRLLSHQTLQGHHRLGHPSLQRLRGLHSRLLVSGLLRSLPPLPPLPAPPCLPYIEGRQRAAPESSFPPTTAHLQTLNMDVPFAAAPHFLWLFAVRYATHQLNLWPRVSLPETSPTLRWTGKVGDASFYHPTLRRIFPSQDVTFEESVPFFHLFPYRSAPPPPPPLFLAPDPLPGIAPVQVAVGSDAAPSAASGGAEPRSANSEGAGSGRAELGGAEFEGAGSGGAEPWGVESGGAEPAVVEPRGPEPTVKRPPGSPPAFKARYVARGFSRRQGFDYFQTFSPTPKMTTLRVLLHLAAQRDSKLHSLVLSTAFLQGSLHKEIWLRCPPDFTGSFPAGTQWSLWRPVYGLRQAPCEWHDTLRTTKVYSFYCGPVAVLQRFGFQFSSSQPTPLNTGHSLSAPPLDESVEPSGPYPELVGCLITSGMRLMLGGRGTVVLTGHVDASWVDDSGTQRSSSCEAEIYAGAMAAQELRWLTYLLSDLGKRPRSPLVLYVDNKAMIAFCQEHTLEHKTKHIALRYFLARELQQRGQLRLVYVATRANTADIFTKALPPGDHRRFSTVLGLVPTLPHLLTA